MKTIVLGLLEIRENMRRQEIVGKSFFEWMQNMQRDIMQFDEHTPYGYKPVTAV